MCERERVREREREREKERERERERESISRARKRKGGRSFSREKKKPQKTYRGHLARLLDVVWMHYVAICEHRLHFPRRGRLYFMPHHLSLHSTQAPYKPLTRLFEVGVTSCRTACDFTQLRRLARALQTSLKSYILLWALKTSLSIHTTVSP